ncbi:MAG: YbhB/YbcL family Raf kinase inhibitor-like protein [Pseudomonadota bacterium]|nr:YbhB/YbcL family Raf kinase inhibitor-like protein [Pseudomonadota bacterium]
MKLHSSSFANGAAIPTEFAFGKPGEHGESCVFAGNLNPHLGWRDAPEGTRSFALMCIDLDVPSKPDDVNKQGHAVPAELPRVEFVHWLMIDVPSDCREIAAGSCSDGVTAHGKSNPRGPAGTKQGRNDYTGWFENDPDMDGAYLGYDGPCPPWNDERVHRYRFQVFALDTPSLGLAQGFTWTDAQRAMQGHALAETDYVGTYSFKEPLTQSP